MATTKRYSRGSSLDELQEYGASRSSLRERFGSRRIDASAPNVSLNKNPTGMGRDAGTGFSTGWNEFFGKKPPQPPASIFEEGKQNAAMPSLDEAPLPGTDAMSLASTFDSLPGLEIERGAMPPAGFESDVASRYLGAASKVLSGGAKGLTPKPEWDSMFRKRRI